MPGGKYLFVINSLLAGGAERSLLDFLPELDRRGAEPIVVTLRVADVGFHRETLESHFDLRELTPGSRIAQARSLRKLIRHEQPVLIHTSLFDADLVGRLASIGLQIPVVSTLANVRYDPARLSDPGVERWKLELYRRVDSLTARRLTTHFHAISHAVKHAAVASLGIDAERVSVIPRGRSRARLGFPSEERRFETRQALGLDPVAPLIMTVGREEFQKGHHDLVAAFRDVVDAVPDALLVIVGRRGRSSPEIERQILELGLHARIVRLGHRTDVPDLLAAADVFAFPSLYEGLGGAVIEAMALSLPVVASDLPAIKEVVEDGRNGLLVPPGDPARLAEGLIELLLDDVRRASFAKESMEIYEQRFRLERANPALADLLERLARAS